MISLKNVSVETLNISLYSPDIQKIIEKEKVISIYDLIKMKPKYPDCDWSFINKKIKKIVSVINESNEKGNTQRIYCFRKYDDERLSSTDKLNKGDVLLLSSPTIYHNTELIEFNNLSIEKIKEYLKTSTPNGSNFLMTWYRNRIDLVQLIKALNFYQRQVLRQADLTDIRDDNVFKYQYLEKEEIVKDLYEDIIAFFIHNKYDFVWGKLDENEKAILLRSIAGKEKDSISTRNMMVKNISNYTTLPELEKVYKKNYEALNRFLIK